MIETTDLHGLGRIFSKRNYKTLDLIGFRIINYPVLITDSSTARKAPQCSKGYLAATIRLHAAFHVRLARTIVEY